MKPTILVIDDSEDDQRLYQRAFKDSGCHFNLDMVSSAEMGFARIADAKPELILLDYNLPDMDGLSFMKRLAAHSDTRIPIVMLTGETSAALAVEVMKHGADDYLVKDTEGRYLRLLPGVAGRVMATYTQKEEALRLRQKNETLLLCNQVLMQNSMDGIHILDAQGNLVEANDAFYRMLGYTRDEMSRFNVTDWDAKWSAEEMRHRIRHLIGKSTQFETVHRRKDRTLIDVEISSSWNEIEGQYFLFAASRDITERKNTEAALLRSEANLHAMLDNSPYLSWMKDAEGRYIAMNKVFADYLRLEDYKQALGKTDFDLQPHELAKKYRADDAEVMAARQQKHVEESSFDGKTLHWVETYKTPIIDAHGNVLGTVGFARDITERIRAESVIRESAQRLQAHIENSPMAVVSWDKDLNVTQWSGEAERMFGWKAAETVGKPIMDLNMIYEEDIPLVHGTMEKIREAQQYVISPNRNVTKDGRVIHCVWYNSVLSNKDGTMDSVMSLVLDVTEHKQIEQEMAVLNIQLTHEVAKRTADLSALTAHIQKIAETEKANLARELHDELGSNMAAVIMNVGRLKGKTIDPDLLQDLSSIKDILLDTTHTMRAIVSQLYPTGLETYGFVHAVELLVQEYEKHTGIEVELLIPKDNLVMEPAFALAAYRITQECLTNIAKHAEADKVFIEAKTKDGYLDLTISDNGKGLSGEINSGSHGIFGMKERSRYLGGSMEIGSEDGKGTTARLRLPLAVTKPKNRKRVLVVDDHAIVRDALRQLLETQTDEFSVEGEAADGVAGIQMAIDGTWDIILLDISLPKKNGISVLEEVIAAKPDLPIIMLSSYAKDKYAEIALSKGAACYIEKAETEILVEEMRRATLLQ